MKLVSRKGMTTLIVAASMIGLGTAARADNVITLGASVQLTGALANTGRYYKDAYQFAIDKINAAGGVTVGGKSYKLHVPPNVPVKDNWSVTIYDTQTRSMLQTDQQFPTLDTYTKGLNKNMLTFAPCSFAYRIDSFCLIVK